MPSLTVFLDTSVLLAGLASPKGGSGIILEGGAESLFKLVVTDLIIEEGLRRAKRLKIDELLLKQLVINDVINVIKAPDDEFINKFTFITPDPDDAHVLAGAITARADVIVSLDKKHILVPKTKSALKPMKILSPKQFWEWVRNKV